MPPYSDIEEIQKAQAVWKSTVAGGANVSSTGSPDLLSGSAVYVGSGCSLAVAQLLERKLSVASNGARTCCTPYEFVRSNMRPDIGIMVSSKGRHLDAIQCYEEMLRRVGSIVLVTTELSSPLADLALASPERTTVISPKVNVPNDGFLPFVSTVAMAALLLTISPVEDRVDPPFGDLFDRALADHETFTESSPQVHGARAFHIITTFWGRPAGRDLETRLAESGIGFGVVSDPWDIAHGRYLSIHSQGQSQRTVMLGTANEETDFDELSAALPDDLPQYRIVAPFPRFAGSLYCAFRTMCLISWLCALKGVDPANPERPRWGDVLFDARHPR